MGEIDAVSRPEARLAWLPCECLPWSSSRSKEAVSLQMDLRLAATVEFVAEYREFREKQPGSQIVLSARDRDGSESRLTRHV
jgi:hypothetical protein